MAEVHRLSVVSSFMHECLNSNPTQSLATLSFRDGCFLRSALCIFILKRQTNKKRDSEIHKHLIIRVKVFHTACQVTSDIIKHDSVANNNNNNNMFTENVTNHTEYWVFKVRFDPLIINRDILNHIFYFMVH